MDEKLVLSKVFGWMFVGLLVTFLTGYGVSLYPNMLINIFGSWLLLILILLEFGLVIFLSARCFKMKPITAKISFLLYSFISGLTFSNIFIMFEMSSIISVFLITAVIFGLFALIGYKTNMNLGKMGTYLMMGLLGCIICSIVNLFFQNSMFDTVLSIIIIIVFIGYTAFDVQKIKKIVGSNPALPEDNIAIYGALELYLDFVNLFLELLNLIGNSKD